MVSPLVLDGGLSSLLELERGPLHPTLWSAALLVASTGGQGKEAGERAGKDGHNNDDDDDDDDDDDGTSHVFSDTNHRAVIDAHRAFLEAGADILTTVSYQGTVAGFKRDMGLSEEEASHAIALSVTLARTAIHEHQQAQQQQQQQQHIERDKHSSSSSQAPRTLSSSWASSRHLLLHPPPHGTQQHPQEQQHEQQHEQQQEQQPRPLVAASIGPYGAFLADGSEYRGGYDAERLAQFHHEKALILWRARPDVLAFETIPQASEALAIVGMMQETLPEAPYWLSFQCCDAHRLASGDDVTAAVASLVTAFDEQRAGSLIGIGVNCISPAIAAPLVTAIARCVGRRRLHVLCYPNKGEAWDADTRTWGPIPTADVGDGDGVGGFGNGGDGGDVGDGGDGGDGDTAGPCALTSRAWVRRIKAAGCTVVGGCCRVFPADLAQMVRCVKGDIEGGNRRDKAGVHG
ncbi:homocysteine methyltransferase [Salpingoeca rosetta]|uniref:Homocysteine methyltransferase n=1 Tax=Salpingoeca rosetta (strain ATCC 50818 / BSB-021) TaxID=946362 RepID=F2UKC1_SALR5|nr:homocysteine methyltransferase [Salpingoeca rosetta]EGD77570.1 homocysteine methyltransferase [Salpingoeca rosetta]|eukprot:XP_004990458.1 homocysteine methyltransferase [Salpingoeca rosetta]